MVTTTIKVRSISELKEEIGKKIKEHSNPELAKEHGMVHMIWNDGEISCQKSGELLWQRNMHCFNNGYTLKDMPYNCYPPEKMPHKYNEKTGYAFVTNEHADEIRLLMKELVMAYLILE
jgi:hypothetical protein